MDDIKYTILYTMEEGTPYEVLGSYSEEVAWALMEEYERSGILIQYQPNTGHLRILNPASIQLAKVVDMSIQSSNTPTSEGYN